MTVLEVIQRSTEFLAKKGVESPRLQSELLMAHILGIPRLQLYLNFSQPLAENHLAQARACVTRRANREPLQHILGTVSFCGIELKVTPTVLIPRPETEILAEHAWQYLQKLPRNGPYSMNVLDFGTGSGCLAIAVALHCPNAVVYATDISSDALIVAQENARKHLPASRIQFLEGAELKPLPAAIQFALIVANPPYIRSDEIAHLQPEVRDHDPHMALDGGADGLDFYRMLAQEAKSFLLNPGCLMVEFGDGQEQNICDIFLRAQWLVEAIIKDYSARPRVMMAKYPGI